jgi:predicted dienelactone hydrolase
VLKALNRKYQRYALLIATGILAAILIALPVNAADRVFFNYGPFEFSVAVSNLETFAKEGKVERELGFYLNRLQPQPQQQATLRGFLRSRFELNPAVVSRVMYSATGVRLLTRVGDLIETRSGHNGLYGIRAAVSQALADPEGLTVINFLRKFPTDIHLNTAQIIGSIRAASTLIQDTDALVASLEQRTSELAVSEPAIDFTQLLDLREAGESRVVKQTMNLRDPARDREVLTDLYLPEGVGQVPVIIFSNGLGARYDRYDLLARHLASHGFAIAVPDHVGSNDQRQRNFFAGLEPENFDAEEFVDRPLDITFLLNELERINQSELNQRLNLQQVGMFGYSFGGTTALALAGAEIDFNHLEKACTPPINVLDISTLYQCRALELPRQTYSLRDRRIKAAFVFVPFGKSLYGQTGMSQVDIPIFWQAADQDIVTPLVLEQMPFFSWLTSRDRYLAVSKGLPHTLVTVQLLDRLMNTNRAADLEKLTSVTDNYLKALTLAFLKTYVVQDNNYRRYLQASYAQALTEAPYNLNFVRSISPVNESDRSSHSDSD